MAETFQDRFCRHFNVPPERFGEMLFRRALYPRARLVHELLWLRDRGHFAADHEFVKGVGALTRRSDFYTELKDFQFHPDNRGLLRGGLRLRISANRMSRVFFDVWKPENETMTEPTQPSGAPFAPPPAPAPAAPGLQPNRPSFGPL